MPSCLLPTSVCLVVLKYTCVLDIDGRVADGSICMTQFGAANHSVFQPCFPMCVIVCDRSSVSQLALYYMTQHVGKDPS